MAKRSFEYVSAHRCYQVSQFGSGVIGQRERQELAEYGHIAGCHVPHSLLLLNWDPIAHLLSVL